MSSKQQAVAESQIKPNEIEKRVENYRDIEGVSTRRLDLGLWYVRNRRNFFLAAVWLLALVAVVLWSYSLYYFGYYLIVGMKQDRQNNLTLVDQGPLAVRRDYMGNFSFSYKNIIRLTNNQYDLLGEIINHNPKAWANFDYYFMVDGQKMGAGNNFVMPGDKKYISSLLVDQLTEPSQISLVVYNVRWTTIDPHKITNWAEYKESHLDLKILDKKFIAADSSPLSERLPMNTLRFNITNETPFNYLVLPLQIILYSGEDPVAVKDYIINKFKSRQRQDIRITIMGNLPNITEIEIVPDLNILQPDIYFDAD